MSELYRRYLRHLIDAPIPRPIIREEGELYVNLPQIPHYEVTPLMFEEDYGWFSRERPQDRMYLESYRALPIPRLGRIKQLGFLSPVSDPMVEFIGYRHRREGHSIMVARNFELILRQNGYPDWIINTGIFAGLVHDIATPAGGDAIKRIDPEALDEETHWKEYLTPQVLEFAHKYDVDLDLVDKMINGQGLLGEVLSTVDRISYTYVDTAEIYGIQTALRLPKNPYRDVKIDPDKDRFYFLDPNKFYDIFLARAFNHLQIYMDPTNQGRDKIIEMLIKPLYARDATRPLTPQILRSINDTELIEEYIMKYYRLPEGTVGIADLVHNQLNNLVPEVEVFDPLDIKEFENLVGQIKGDSNKFFIGEERSNGFDPGSSYLVQDYHSNGEPISFTEFDPEKAHVLNSLSEACKAFYVYYVDLTSASKEMLTFIEPFIATFPKYLPSPTNSPRHNLR